MKRVYREEEVEKGSDRKEQKSLTTCLRARFA
ncbi:hypothetical protein AVEN_20012-1, partial [Araneus ventricosus]